MAELKFGSVIRKNIQKVSIENSDNIANGKIKLEYSNGAVEEVTFKNDSRFRVECTGNIDVAYFNNGGVLLGNVEYAQVDNVLEVEGYVKKFLNNRGLRIDKSIKVCYGNEKLKRLGITTADRAKIIHLRGDLKYFSCSLANNGLENVIKGNIQNVKAENYLYVKGTVNNCKVGNIVAATMGKSTAISTEEIVKQKKMAEDSFKADMAKFFRNIRVG